MIIHVPDPECPFCKTALFPERTAFEDGETFACPKCNKRFYTELNYESYSYWTCVPVEEEKE